MCAVSALYIYGQNLPPDFWTSESYAEFQKLLRQAQQFDEATKQKDCEDPSKQIWLEQVKEEVNK